jgi:putative SOS response-associated peptidase YedK
MCGRYRRTTSEEELARRYHIAIPSERDLPISWNIAPTQDVLAIRQHPQTKQRIRDALRWGLIPNCAKDPKIAYKTINARVETVDTAPSYREAFKKLRCLIPADSFCEWNRTSLSGRSIPRCRSSFRKKHHDAWLSGRAGKEILVPFPANRMKAWPIDAS